MWVVIVSVQVDPSDFLYMCEAYMSRMSEAEAIHKSTEQYRYVCQDNGFYMASQKEYSRFFFSILSCHLNDAVNKLYHVWCDLCAKMAFGSVDRK